MCMCATHVPIYNTCVYTINSCAEIEELAKIVYIERMSL